MLNAPTGVVEDEDPVNVVWHDHEGVQLDVREMRWNGAPAAVADPSDLAEAHTAGHDFTQERCTPVGADRDEIGPGSAVVVLG